MEEKHRILLMNLPPPAPGQLAVMGEDHESCDLPPVIFLILDVEPHNVDLKINKMEPGIGKCHFSANPEESPLPPMFAKINLKKKPGEAQSAEMQAT